MFGDIGNWIEDHPVGTAIIAFLVFFVGYQVVKNLSPGSNTSTSTPSTSTPPSTGHGTNPIWIQGPQGPAGPGGPVGPTGPTGPVGPIGPTPGPTKPPPVHNPPASTAKYVTVQPYPAQLSTLSGIAAYAHESLQTVESLNPQYSRNWNLIYAGQKVRIA